MRSLDLPSARFDCNRARYSAVCMAVASVVSALSAQTIVIDSTPAARQQEIDGFGTCISSTEGQQAWWQNLFLDDLGASILRLDLVPGFKTPWNAYNYYSPWYLGNGAQPFAFNFQIQTRSTGSRLNR